MYGIANWLTPYESLAPGTTFVVGAWPRPATLNGVSYYGKPESPFAPDGMDSRLLKQLYEKRWIKAVPPKQNENGGVLADLGIANSDTPKPSLFNRAAENTGHLSRGRRGRRTRH